MAILAECIDNKRMQFHIVCYAGQTKHRKKSKQSAMRERISKQECRVHTQNGEIEIDLAVNQLHYTNEFSSLNSFIEPMIQFRWSYR